MRQASTFPLGHGVDISYARDDEGNNNNNNTNGRREKQRLEPSFPRCGPSGSDSEKAPCSSGCILFPKRKQTLPKQSKAGRTRAHGTSYQYESAVTPSSLFSTDMDDMGRAARAARLGSRDRPSTPTSCKVITPAPSSILTDVEPNLSCWLWLLAPPPPPPPCPCSDPPRRSPSHVDVVKRACSGASAPLRMCVILFESFT